MLLIELDSCSYMETFLFHFYCCPVKLFSIFNTIFKLRADNCFESKYSFAQVFNISIGMCDTSACLAVFTSM